MHNELDQDEMRCVYWSYECAEYIVSNFQYAFEEEC